MSGSVQTGVLSSGLTVSEPTDLQVQLWVTRSKGEQLQKSIKLGARNRCLGCHEVRSSCLVGVQGWERHPDGFTGQRQFAAAGDRDCPRDT